MTDRAVLDKGGPESGSEVSFTAEGLDPIEVSIVIPCLDEADTIGRCVEEANRALRDAGIGGEVIVADNGSTDDSGNIARYAGAGLVTVRRRGYGSAIIGGIAASRGKYIVIGDADGSYDFSATPLFVERLRQGDELVMGCRL